MTIRPLLAALLLAVPVSGSAQQVDLMLNGGIALTSLAVDPTEGEDLDGGTGLALGMGGMVSLTDHVGVRFSWQYMARSASITDADLPGLVVNVDTENLELVPMLALRSGNVYLLAGPYFGHQHMCDISATVDGRTISAECGDEVEFRDTDFGVVGGIGLRMPLGGIGTFVEATYALGVSEIDDTAEIAIKNRALAIQVGLSYTLDSSR